MLAVAQDNLADYWSSSSEYIASYRKKVLFAGETKTALLRQRYLRLQCWWDLPSEHYLESIRQRVNGKPIIQMAVYESSKTEPI